MPPSVKEGEDDLALTLSSEGEDDLASTLVSVVGNIVEWYIVSTTIPFCLPLNFSRSLRH